MRIPDTIANVLKNHANARLIAGGDDDDGGAIQMGRMRIIVSWGGGWDHVSVSLPDRCPTWQEMCAVKRMFWRDDEWVVQFHPAASEYVNNHPHCLHLWKPQDQAMPTPPSEFVGIKT